MISAPKQPNGQPISSGFGEDYFVYLTMKSLMGTECKVTISFKVYASVKEREDDNQFKIFEPADVFKLEGKTLNEKQAHMKRQMKILLSDEKYMMQFRGHINELKKQRTASQRGTNI